MPVCLNTIGVTYDVAYCSSWATLLGFNYGLLILSSGLLWDHSLSFVAIGHVYNKLFLSNRFLSLLIDFNLLFDVSPIFSLYTLSSGYLSDLSISFLLGFKSLGLNCWFYTGLFNCCWVRSVHFFNSFGRCLWFFALFLNDSLRYAHGTIWNRERKSA